MKIFLPLITVVLIGLFLILSNNADKKSSSNQLVSSSPNSIESDDKPVIELVFCLDATGSMSGLIHTAKEKIWDIVNVIAQAKPSPDIRLGMIFYRDLNDEFVTKVYPHTDNLDSIYSELLAIKAEGGGDTPESVNQALNEAVTKMNWTNGKKTYHTIFLIGDCPPHMDYEQDIEYSSSCELAKKNGIIINTIKLGTECTEAIEHFKTIAKATNGEYQQLGQNANDVIIETPHDDSISYYSNNIDASKIYYGNKNIQSSMLANQKKSLSLYNKSTKNAIASRGNFSLQKSGEKNFYGTNELIQEIVTNKVKLEDIKENELPEKMLKMNKEERLKYIEKLKMERKDNLDNLKRLSALREKYIHDKMKEDPDKISFSAKIFEVIKRQAALKGIEFIN